MRRREFLGYGATLAVSGAIAGCSSGPDDEGGVTAAPAPAAPEAAQPKVVVQWNEMALAAIREVKPGPPMCARSLAIVHTAMYDAWAAYDPVAVGTRLSGLLRRPESERTNANKAKAMSFAAYAALVDQFPSEKARFDAELIGLGFTATTVVDPGRPEGVGNLAAQAVIDYRRNDGANQSGALAVGGAPYADYTAYAPVNAPAVFHLPTPLSGIVAPGRWQPISYFDAGGVTRTPGFIGPHWQNVIPFALTSASQFRPAPPAALGTPEFAAQAQHVIDVQLALTEEQKVRAEYWADGPRSELPPGHWCLFAQLVSARDNHSNDADVKMFFAMTNAILDASISTWDAKRFYDYARPISAIRFLKNGQSFMGYGPGGPAAGLVNIQGEAWRTFQVDTFPTPPFPEYTSGHSAFSAAGGEVLKLYTGSDAFGGTYTQPAKTLRADNKLPTQDVVLTWPTFTEAANEAGISRIYGGIHFEDGNNAGLELGRNVGAQAFARAKRYWEGTA